MVYVAHWRWQLWDVTMLLLNTNLCDCGRLWMGAKPYNKFMIQCTEAHLCPWGRKSLWRNIMAAILKMVFNGTFSSKLVVFWLNLITYKIFSDKSPPDHVIVWCRTVDESLTDGWFLMMAWRQTDGMRFHRPMITRLIMKRLTFYLQIHYFTPSWTTGVIAIFITSSSHGYLLYISVNKMAQTLPAWRVLLNGPPCYGGSTKVGKLIDWTERFIKIIVEHKSFCYHNWHQN